MKEEPTAHDGDADDDMMIERREEMRAHTLIVRVASVPKFREFRF